MSPPGLTGWLAARFANLAAARLRRRYPDWADAVLSEHASLVGERGQLGWSLGALQASFALPASDLVYPVALAFSILAMALYQWSADEGLVTVAVLAALGVALGVLRPSRFLVSGLAVGAVVAAVNGFETVSGVRPAYEAHLHSLAHDLRWLVLVLPALAASALGRLVALALA